MGANYEQPGVLSACQSGELREHGFTVLAHAVPQDQLAGFGQAYDHAMKAGAEADRKVGRTTTRVNGLLFDSAEFDGLCNFPPLLEACAHLLGEPFRLSSLLGRTLHAGAGSQTLHADLPRDSPHRPMLGFIVMVDEFRADNGATRFVPGSHRWTGVPEPGDQVGAYPGEVLACAAAGSMVVFDAAVWHGHTANRSASPRRSVQGYFVRRSVPPALDFRAGMRPERHAQLGALTRSLLGLDEAG